jgi:uncharacterized OB-fold protein
MSETFTMELPYKRSVGPVVGEFLTALRDGRFVGVRTGDGRVLCPPFEYDPETGEPLSEFVDLADTGTVVAAARVEQPLRYHVHQEPFSFALVRLDGADTAFVHTVLAPADQVQPGLRVQARWRDERVGHVKDVLAFVPAGPGA